MIATSLALFIQKVHRMKSVELFVPDSKFVIEEMEDTLRIVFPSDCPYRGQFFYFPKSIEHAASQQDGWKLSLDGTAEITILNLIKNQYDVLSWELLAIQIERYLKERRL